MRSAPCVFTQTTVSLAPIYWRVLRRKNHLSPLNATASRSRTALRVMEQIIVTTKPTKNGTQIDPPEQKPQTKGMNTLSVHGGGDRERANRAFPMPRIQSGTYAFADPCDLVNFMQ